MILKRHKYKWIGKGDQQQNLSLVMTMMVLVVPMNKMI